MCSEHHGFAVHVGVVPQDDSGDRCGTVSISDRVWAPAGSTDEERSKHGGRALVYCLTQNRA
jgi:hypothetical protein